MANIRITKVNAKKYNVTVDEYPDIVFSEDTYTKARNKAVEMVKTEIAKNIPAVETKEEAKKPVKFGFAA